MGDHLRAIVQGDDFQTHPAVKEIYEDARSVTLQGSVWDLTLFMFYRPLGKSTNWPFLYPVILTVTLQVSFLSIVVLFIVSSEDPPASLREGFALWRSGVEPAVADAVCTGNLTLTSSFKQASTFETYKAYTDSLYLEGHGFHSAGPITCFVVCNAWLLTILKELGGVLDKLLGVW